MGDLTSYDDFKLTKTQIDNIKPFVKINRSPRFTNLQHTCASNVTHNIIPLSRRKSTPNPKVASTVSTNMYWVWAPEFFETFDASTIIHPPNHKTDEELEREYHSWLKNGGVDESKDYLFYM